jgi:hypothetical protein
MFVGKQFRCECGEKGCRGEVREGDWKEDFMEEYEGHCSGFVEELRRKHKEKK